MQFREIVVVANYFDMFLASKQTSPASLPWQSNPSRRDSSGWRNRSKDRAKSAILNGHFPHCVVSMATVVEGRRAKGSGGRERG